MVSEKEVAGGKMLFILATVSCLDQFKLQPNAATIVRSQMRRQSFPTVA